MTGTFLAVVVAVVTLASSVISHPWFQQQIPNGAIVPNPCNRSTIWMGVGHQNLIGGGTLNPFGIDFRANNFTWNLTICQKDSDGDTYSNGYELGDPNCTWSVGQTPSRGTNLTHPGICEPLGSTKCADKNSWLTNCNNTQFNCPGINDPGVKNYTMRFPVSQVPAAETTYICNRYLFPNDSIADIIAIEPVLDNLQIIHHMLLYACVDEPSDLPNNGTFMCGMGGGMSCTSLIEVWAFGQVGQCLYSQLGFRIGPGAFQYAVLQIHWNNPQLKASLTDSSGMKIYYTTNLRPNRGEIVIVGQNYLEIPPGKDDVTLYGNCSSLCSKSVLNQSVYITSVFLHMHMLGKSGNIWLYRNGAPLTLLNQVDHYDYNMPTMIEFDTPIEMKPGDSIKVKCVYSSIGKNTTTYFGEGTSDEMCYGFFAYYPQIKGFDLCGQWRSINWCSIGINGKVSSDYCDLTTFLKYSFALPTLCASSCMASSCVAAFNAAVMTGCQRYDDVRSFLQTFIQEAGSALAYCSLAQPPCVVSTTLGNNKISISTTPGNNKISISPTPENNKISNVASHGSPLRGSYFDSVLLLAVVVYARHLF